MCLNTISAMHFTDLHELWLVCGTLFLLPQVALTRWTELWLMVKLPRRIHRSIGNPVDVADSLPISDGRHVSILLSRGYGRVRSPFYIVRDLQGIQSTFLRM
jgi:hypothetical protein